MAGNPIPWILMALAGLAALMWKGYLTPPWAGATRRASPPAAPGTPAAAPNPGDQLDSRTLGLLFALAKQREAQGELARRLADQAGELIKGVFDAPFSAPPPAGHGEQAAGGRP